MSVWGFIGTGNMGGALAKAAAKKEGIELLLSNRTREKAAALAEVTGGTVTDNETIADHADVIFLGVKPQMMADLLTSLHSVLAARKSGFVLVTMAAGLTISRIREMAGGPYPVIRIMPNTPVAIGCGSVLYTAGEGVQDETLNAFLTGLSSAGSFHALPEHLMDAGSAVSGCGPAFVDLFIEALADGGVACGLPRATALALAAETVQASGALVRATGKSPAELKDAVCSPEGTTIQGVRALEAGAFRGTTMNAVIAAFEKNKDFH